MRAVPAPAPAAQGPYPYAGAGGGLPVQYPGAGRRAGGGGAGRTQFPPGFCREAYRNGGYCRYDRPEKPCIFKRSHGYTPEAWAQGLAEASQQPVVYAPTTAQQPGLHATTVGQGALPAPGGAGG